MKTLRPTKRPSDASCRRRRPLRPVLQLSIERLEDRLVPTNLPTGFIRTVIATELLSPTAMEIAPDGRIFVAEQGGALRVIENGSLLPEPFFDLNVNSSGERGLLGIAFDPDFATNQFIYVYYTTATMPPQNRISRFTADGNVVKPNSEKVLLDLGSIGGTLIHNGGAVHFGNDEKLYVAVGDNANGSNSQTLNNLMGKLLRINTDPDNLIPDDNPFVDLAAGNNRTIWALGLRNPFTFAVQPGTGRIFINDVGQSTWEEINDGIAGSNYGWPNSEGLRQPGDVPTAIGTYRDPIVQYGHGRTSTTGCAIAGGAFYSPATNQFPADYVGDYFFADLCSAWIRRYDPVSQIVTGFATDLPPAPVDLKVDAAGNLYYLTRGFGPDTGEVARVEFPAGQDAPAITQHPASQQVAVCQPATFRVIASGAEPLDVQWQRDGVDIPGASSSTLTLTNLTLADHGAKFRAVVSNSFGNATSNEATLTVIEDQAPTGTILSPALGSHYNAGDTINFSGTAADPEEGNLAASAFTWRVDFHHADHIHPFLQPFGGVTAGSFQVPTVGETSTDVFFRIHLAVTDSLGCSHATLRDVSPNTAAINLQTNPAGLMVTLDGQPVATSSSIPSVVGMRRTLGFVSPQAMSGTHYRFVSWSDGGTARHEITTPAQDTTYTATYTVIGAPVITQVHANALGKTARQIEINFSSALDPIRAINPNGYQIISAGRDRRFHTPARPSADDVRLAFDAPSHHLAVDATTAAMTPTVKLRVPRGFSNNTFYQLVVDGSGLGPADPAITGINSDLLDGELVGSLPSGDGTAGGDFIILIGLGKRLSYLDSNGDQVLLTLKRQGTIEITREAPVFDGISSEGLTLRLSGTGNRSVLSGRVSRVRGSIGSDGRTSFDRVTGLVGVRNNVQNNSAFVLGQVSAWVVDRLLDSDDTLLGSSLRRGKHRQ